MPNHVTNRLTLHCGSTEAANVFAEIGGTKNEDGEERFIDFNKIIPYPDYFEQADRASEEWRKQNPQSPWSDGPKDGYNHGGHEWCKKSWGTKWNAFSQERFTDTSVRFDTAWSTPVPIFDALSAKYPSLAFEVEYADEDMGRNAGILHYRKGRQGESGLHGIPAVKLWFNLHPDSDPEEYGYDPVTVERSGKDDE